MTKKKIVKKKPLQKSAKAIVKEKPIPKQPKPFTGKGPIRAKVLDAAKVRNMLNIETKFTIGEYVKLTDSEYYDLQEAGAVELSEGEKKALGKRRNKANFLDVNENDLEYFLGGSDEPPKRLGQGVHEGSFYYAVKTNNGFGLITSKKRFYPVYEKIVLDGTKANRIVVDKVAEEFKLDYLSQFDGTAVDNTWAKRDSMKYLNGEAKPKPGKEIFVNLTEKNQEHIWHPDSRHHKLFAGFIMSTYCFELFDVAPRLNIFALTESGKSTESKIIKNACFSPIWFSRGSTASLFRSVEGTCGIPILDNFDKLSEELKEATFHFIETSFDREGRYRLCESSQSNWKTKTYFTFCPMVINSTIAFEDAALENRCILVRMEKTSKRFKKINPKEAFWKNTRNDCRLWVLENWQEIEKTRDWIDNNETRLKDRALDIWLPILTMAKLGDCYEELVNLAVEKTEEQKEFSEGESFSREITFYILDIIEDKPSEIFELGKLAKEYALSVSQTTDEAGKEKYAASKQRMFLKMIKNFLKSQPSLWKKENLSRPHNRETIEIHKKALERVAVLRGYKPNMENELTQLNQLNQVNIRSPNLTNKEKSGYLRLSQVKSVSEKKEGENGLVLVKEGTTSQRLTQVKSVKSNNGTSEKKTVKKEENLEKCKVCGVEAVLSLHNGRWLCSDCRAREPDRLFSFEQEALE